MLTFIRTLLVLLIACFVMQTGGLEQLMAFIDKQAAHFLNLLFSSTALRSSLMFISRRWNEACNLDDFCPQRFVFRVYVVQFDDTGEFISVFSLLFDGFGGLVVSMLASGTQVCGFKPGRSRWIFRT